MGADDMNFTDTRHLAQTKAVMCGGWDEDNSMFVVDYLLPHLGPRPEVRQVIRWAYGFDGSPRSYEKESDGSSLVHDWYMNGIIKEPFGVAHDMLWILKGETGKCITPDGREWSWWDTNVWYKKAMDDFRFRILDEVRFVGLTLGSYPLWLTATWRMKRKKKRTAKLRASLS